MKIDAHKLARVIARVGSFVWNIGDDTFQLDRTASELLGAREPVTSFEQVLAVLGDESRERLVEALAKAVRGGGAFEVDIQLERGREIPSVLRLRGTVLFDPAGAPELAIGALQDVSELAQARSRLVMVSQALESATLASRDRAALIGELGHELRTQLNAVVNLNRTCLEAEPPGQRRDELEEVQRSSEHLVTLVDEVLALATTEGTESDLELGVADVRALLAEVTAPFVAMATDGVEIRTVCADDAPAQVRTDLRRLRRALHHVLADSVRRAQTGTIAISASARDEDTVAFVVETGLAPVRNVHRAIAKQLIEVIGGTLQETERGVVLYIRNEPPSDAMPIASLRVLVAEDNIVNQRVVAALLGKRGHTTVFARTGLEAVERAGRERFDVVLMDVNMPVMDGLAATREIVRQFGERRPRIVAMTANALAGDRGACLAAGCDDYVSKPLTPEKLDAALRAATAPRTTDAPAPIDLAELDALSKDLGPAFLARFVRSFDDDTRDLHARLEQAVAQSDASALVRAAHVLRASAQKIGAHALGVRCSEVEALARRSRLDTARDAVAAIGEELANVRAAIAARLAN